MNNAQRNSNYITVIMQYLISKQSSTNILRSIVT